MSVYSFNETAPTASTTTTSAFISANDQVPVISANTGRMSSVTIAAMDALDALTFASTITVNGTAYSTTNFISNFGVTIFQSTGGSSCVWVLNDPTVPGIWKTLVMGTTSTSTYFGIIPVSATIAATSVNGGSLVNLGAATGSPQANSVTLTAQTTSLWLVTAKNGAALYN